MLPEHKFWRNVDVVTNDWCRICSCCLSFEACDVWSIDRLSNVDILDCHWTVLDRIHLDDLL